MRVKYSVGALNIDDDWLHLLEELGAEQSQVIHSTLRHLKILGVKSYLIEEPYIDRDYSADYFHFYSRTFRNYTRHCKRAHFFAVDITGIIHSSDWSQHLTGLRNLSPEHYCGFSVVRPLPGATIGRTVLSARLSDRQEMDAVVTCRAEFTVNLLGIKYLVTGTAYVQQDARVGACAQVAIWMGMRHMHARYGYNWVSVADITRLASPINQSETGSLPAGSDGLTSEPMLRAINDAGYQPLCLYGSLTARDILPYVESGIPVIVGLNIDNEVGHAVTVIGRVFARQDEPTNEAFDYIAAYLMHDDQGGPYTYLPVVNSSDADHAFEGETVKCPISSGEVELTTGLAEFAVVLMSTRVFSTAAQAEISVRDRIDFILSRLNDFRQMLAQREISIDERLLDELNEANSTDTIVLKTYLTSAAGYRRYIAECSCCDELKTKLLEFHLPHFTWITEISTIDSYNNSDPSECKIYGHIVTDATSTAKDGDGLLLVHIPSLLITKEDSTSIDQREILTIIQQDKLYNSRAKRQ